MEALRSAAARAGALLGRRESLLLASLAIVLSGPFMLQARDTTAPVRYDRRLVILSPHTERIRNEIGRAFARDWKDRTGETLYLDWRIPGGASEIALFLKSEFSSAFQYHWEHRVGKTWDQAVAATFAEPRVPDHDEPRRAFLGSDVGIGVDLLFGGGSYDFQQQAEAGYLVAQGPDGRTGPLAVMRRRPDWFGEAVIPERVGGEPFRDPAGRWVGVVLATFGIVYNRDVLQRLALGRDPTSWSDLADPALAGQVALADPSKSGSVAKAFELIIQEQMHRAVEASTAATHVTVHLAAQGTGRAMEPSEAIKAVEQDGVRLGWDAGFRLIQRISGNARYFTDSASKIPLEVMRGDAAAGMAIDSYGRATAEFVRRPDGRSRVGFVAPKAGTSLSVDPIAMLRGAPDPELATAFIEFVLSMEGQRLWAYRPGAPGGPMETALRRLPVRKDFYNEENRPYMSDGGERPYSDAVLVYRPEWTAPMFGAIRFLIRVMCVDTHQELKEAWQALRRSGFPPDAVAAFHDLGPASYEGALTGIVPALRARDRIQEVRLARELADRFRQQYRLAARLADAGARRP